MEFRITDLKKASYKEVCQYLLIKNITLKILIVILLILIPLAMPGSHAETVTLYDSSLNTLPADQGWVYGLYPLPSPLGNSAAKQIFDADLNATHLDTSDQTGDSAGYFSSTPEYTISFVTLPAMSHPDMPDTLDRATGFKIIFEARIISENHVRADRAGFSVIVTSSDVSKAIELGFWENEIWAQEGGAEPDLFTHSEGIAFDTTAGMTLYELTVLGDTYTLSADGTQILTGPLRDYTAFSGSPPFDYPYKTPNFLFLGDDTSSADADIYLKSVRITMSLSEPVTVTTVRAESVTDTTATAHGSATGDGITGRGFSWRTEDASDSGLVSASGPAGAGDFSSTLSGLEPDTRYYFRAYVMADGETVYGNELDFTTGPPVLPTVVSLTEYAVNPARVTLNGEVTASGSGPVTERGFCRGTLPEPTVSDNKSPADTGTGPFAVTIEGLTPGTRYYFRAYAANTFGTAYGESFHIDLPFFGDVNGDEKVSLADGILVLKILAGIDPGTVGIQQDADVNGDGRLGMAEVIYILGMVGQDAG